MEKEILRRTSQNGRWGVSLVGPEGTEFPVQGRIEPLGRVDGHDVFRVVPDTETQTWVAVLGGDVEVLGGATTVVSSDLQGGNVVTVLLLGPQAVVRSWGYKRRSSRVEAYVRGVRTDIPSSVLLAMGLIAPQEAPKPISAPEPLDGPMAAAFARLQGGAR